MCGITGFFDPRGFDARAAVRTVDAMTQRIRTRGPDAQSNWCDADAGIALGHARLSVIEISDSGAQPMVSASGRFVVAFNGEIYNHLDLREDLASQVSVNDYRGHSDTETLLAGFDVWGIERTLKRSVGMFAFALWDRQRRELHLGRDRFGEKPLYYGWQGEGGTPTLLFGSELKALHAHPGFEKRLNTNSAARFFERLCVPGTASIFAGIGKVKPGTYLTFSAGSQDATPTEYWSVPDAVARGAANRFNGNNQAVLEQMDALFSRAVKRQMLSDVPLGAFLSGGVDSSAVVAQMCRHSTGPVKTFTIGFDDPRFDESAYAAAVAKHLGTDHTKITVTTDDAQSLVPKLCEIYDEPFADASQIPTHIVSKLARDQVTVSLTGDGADELFAGYSRYGKTLRAWQLRGKLPSRVWTILAPAARAVEQATRNSPRLEKLTRAARVSGLYGELDIASYYAAASNFSRLDRVTQHVGQRDRQPLTEAQSELETLCAFDVGTYLCDDILVKVDRAAMATSLETRAPFLDHELAEFAFSLPPQMKRHLSNGEIATKWPVRQLLYQQVPQALIERPKMGFGVPIGSWLRGGLKDWAEGYLMDPTLGADGVLDAKAVRRLWAAHQRGSVDHSALLWAVLMFCAWRETWL